MTIKVFVGYHAGVTDNNGLWGFAHCEILSPKMVDGKLTVKCLDGSCMEGEILKVAYNGKYWSMVN